MDLSIATHFGQGGDYSQSLFNEILAIIAESQADGVRDGLGWHAVEPYPGYYDFSSFTTSYITSLIAAGVDPIITLQPHGNPWYDGNTTVTTDGGVQAFANFVLAVANQFPGLTQIAIGNEFNGLSPAFVSGVAAVYDVPQRVAYYTDILRAVHTTIDATHPDMQIIGGALHSIPTGYVQAMVTAGTFQYMDALDVHPYEIDPIEVQEAMDRLNVILDTLPPDQRPEIVVTEFGDLADLDDPLSNASYLAKMVAILAESGVSDATWYALLDEDWSATPNMGLYDRVGVSNDMLPGFQFAAGLLDGTYAVTKVATPSEIELYDFGNGTWLVWGGHQAVSFLGDNLVFRNAAGTVIDAPDTLSDAPVYVQGANFQVVPAEGPGALLADSFYDFSLDADPTSGWSYHLLATMGGADLLFQLELLDGQTYMGESWNPYLGNQYSRPFMVSASTVFPVGFNDHGTDERAAFERYTVATTGPIDITASWDVSADTTDGVVVEVRVNDATVLLQRVTDMYEVALRDIDVEAGQNIDFIIRDGGASFGDATERHYRITTADAATSTDTLLALHTIHDLIEGNERALPTPPPDPDTTPDPDPGPDPDTGPDPDPVDVVPTIEGTLQGELIFGTAGDDVIFAYAGADTVLGTDGNDTLDGGDGDDAIIGGNGNNLIFGGSGADMLNGAGGSNTLYGGLGDDNILGGAGSDTGYGGDGNDTIMANDGDDLLYGGAGSDLLMGGAGIDTLHGGSGDDNLNGGSGADVFIFAPNAGVDWIQDLTLAEGDRLDFTAFGLSSGAQIGLRSFGSFSYLQVDTGTGWVDVVRIDGLSGTSTMGDLTAANALIW